MFLCLQLVVTVLQKLGAKPGAKVAALGTPDQVRSMGSVHSMAHSLWGAPGASIARA